MSRTTIRVDQLDDQIGTPYPRAVLHCFECGSDYSAHRGDYFLSDPSTVIKCCGEPVQRVIYKTTIHEVRP